MGDEPKRPWVIVGGGLAAGRAAAALRKEGFDGRLVVIAEESHEPYERPPLSKEYLRGEKPVEKLAAADESVWEAPETELLLRRRALKLDLARREVETAEGGGSAGSGVAAAPAAVRTIPYGTLLLATGSSANRPTLPGATLPFVHVLRTIDDADRIRAATSEGSTVVVAGGGWIGAEVAASLTQMGRRITLAIPGAEVLEQRLGREVGAIYSALHESHGARIVRRVRVVEAEEGRSGRGVWLSSGEFLPADTVVLGFGATPNVELARDAGLAIDAAGGVVADAHLRTAADGVFIAGDVAAPFHPRYGRRLRLEHWDTARQQGRTAALNMLDRGVEYTRVPYFYSDQYDLGMETWGIPGDAGQVRIRRLANDGFVAAWIDDGRVVAATHGNDWDENKTIERLVRDQIELDGDRFADASIPLVDFLPAEQPA